MGFAHRLFYVRVLVQVGKTRLDFAELIGTFVRLVRLLSRLEDSWRQRGRTHIITSIYTKQVCVCVLSLTEPVLPAFSPIVPIITSQH